MLRLRLGNWDFEVGVLTRNWHDTIIFEERSLGSKATKLSFRPLVVIIWVFLSSIS